MGGVRDEAPLRFQGLPQLQVRCLKPREHVIERNCKAAHLVVSGWERDASGQVPGRPDGFRGPCEAFQRSQATPHHPPNTKEGQYEGNQQPERRESPELGERPLDEVDTPADLEDADDLPINSQRRAVHADPSVARPYRLVRGLSRADRCQSRLIQGQPRAAQLERRSYEPSLEVGHLDERVRGTERARRRDLDLPVGPLARTAPLPSLGVFNNLGGSLGERSVDLPG